MDNRVRYNWRFGSAWRSTIPIGGIDCSSQFWRISYITYYITPPYRNAFGWPFISGTVFSLQLIYKSNINSFYSRMLDGSISMVNLQKLLLN